MPDKPISVPAIDVFQSGKHAFLFVVKGKTLFQYCTVSRREEDKEKGYQRNLRYARARSIASFVDAGGLIPNNIIVNLSEQAIFADGVLTIPAVDDAGWVIDGQHRLWGLHLAKTDVDVTVLAYIGLTVEDQANMFIKINSTQKGVPSSLYLDLLNIIGEPESLDNRVRDIVSQLNTEEDSPWYQQINMTGEGSGLISLVNFARKLRPLIDFEKGVLKVYTLEEQYRILFNYFDGIKNVYYDQWVDPKSKLTKTIGFGALMNAFPHVFQLTNGRFGGFTPKNVQEMFGLIDDFKFDAETLGSGTGNKAEIAAGLIITERIAEALKETAADQGLIRLVD